MIVRALAATSLLAFTAGTAQAVSPVSYAMLNGQTGSYTYWDDSYDGSGSTTTSLSPLSGGTGDLTDGIIATEHWDDTPFVSNRPFVGWFGIDPTIDFTFSGPTLFDRVTIYFDNNPDQFAPGGVVLPEFWTVTVGAASFTYTTSAAERLIDSPRVAQTLLLGGLSASNLSITIDRAGNGQSYYFMASEVTFNAVPEPASWALMALGFGLTGAALRRRSRLRVVSA